MGAQEGRQAPTLLPLREERARLRWPPELASDRPLMALLHSLMMRQTGEPAASMARRRWRGAARRLVALGAVVVAELQRPMPPKQGWRAAPRLRALSLGAVALLVGLGGLVLPASDFRVAVVVDQTAVLPLAALVATAERQAVAVVVVQAPLVARALLAGMAATGMPEFGAGNMKKKWTVIEEIDGVKVVTNLVIASEEVAKERGWFPADNLEIGMIEKGGKWTKPVAIPPKPDKLEALLDTLVRKGVITAAERPNGHVLNAEATKEQG